MKHILPFLFILVSGFSYSQKGLIVSLNGGGNTFNNTYSYGINAQYRFPIWSISTGVELYSHQNKQRISVPVLFRGYTDNVFIMGGPAVTIGKATGLDFIMGVGYQFKLWRIVLQPDARFQFGVRNTDGLPGGASLNLSAGYIFSR